MSSTELPSPDPSLTDLEDGAEKVLTKPENLEDKQEQPTEFTTAGTLTLVGAFVSMFCSIGFMNAFGVFQEYYSQTLLADKSASTIAWLGSFNIFIIFGGTFLVGFLNDKYGPRTILLFGSVVMIFAMFMTSICKEYYQLFLAQGLLLGFGISFLILPPLATIPLYFIKARGLALGIIISGSSLGGVIWPIVLRRLFVQIGFGWAVRICGFIMLPCLTLACLTIKPPKRAANTPKRKPDLSATKNLTLLILGLGMFFVYLGLFSPFFYITSWTISLGLDANMGFYMVSIINASSLFGRIIPGFFADRCGAYNTVILSAGLSGLVCMCWTKATTIPGIAVFSLAYGFVSGAVIGIQGACCAKLVQPHQYGVGMGTVMSILSIAALIGTPINGQLLSAFSYLGISLFSGLAMIIGMLILSIARLRIDSKLIASI